MTTFEAVKGVCQAGVGVITGSLSPDYGQGFQNACEEADMCIDDLSKLIELPMDEIAATRQQLQNKEILISAFGRHNAGKSTLLNALLHDELLPMNLRNETGIKVNIQHDSKIHKGPCTSRCRELDVCPQLRAEGQPSDLAHGSGKVYEKLKAANLDAKISGCQSKLTRYTIVGHVPALANAPQGWKVMMTDNPGFGEAHQEYITQLAETSLKTSTAYLYVVDVSQLQDKVDAHSFKLLHAKDEGVFVNKRVIIAVTQFDKTFSPVVEHNQMTEEEAKRIVCGMIKSSTGFKASQDLVIPVCSMWAFVARKFRHVPNDGRFRQYIRSELEKCPGPRGQQENPEELGPALLADRLEEESGIDILEERLRGMTGACAEIWATAMTKNYNSYLKVAVEGVKGLLDSATKKLQERETNLKLLMERYEFIERSQTKLSQSKKDGSAVYQDLLRKSLEDVEGLKATLSQHTDEFAQTCEKKIQGREKETYGPDEFEKDLTEFCKEVTTKLEEAADAMCGFKETCAAYRAHAEKVGELFTQIKSRAQEFPASVEVPNATTGKDVETDITAIFQNRKIPELTTKVPIPELTLTFFETIGWYMRSAVSWLFGRPKYSYTTHECLNHSMEQLREHVNDTGKLYLADIEAHVAKHFFEGYSEVVSKALEDLKGDYQKIKNMKEEGEARVESLKDEVDKFRKSQRHTRALMNKLEQRREEYCVSLHRQFNHDGRAD